MTPTTARIHVVSEGVVASYIHDISSRTARRRTPVERRTQSVRRSLPRRRASTQERLS
jgi:hypothetical protein